MLGGLGASASAAAEPLVAAAGDIACDNSNRYFNRGWGRNNLCQQRATSRLLSDANVVLPLGDLQYEHGTLREFRASYALSWGRYRSRTRPTIGNHEYGTESRPRINRGEGYWDYFGSRAGPRFKGWYSFNLAKNWHLISLNSNCWAVGGCDGDSPQGRWLERDLAKQRDKECIIGFWHHPRFSSGRGGNYRNVQPLWRRLQRQGKADIILVGHDHVYERFAPQSAFGTPMRTGIRQFMVGTGGKNFGEFYSVKRNSVVRRRDHGVLKIRLLEKSYRWTFVNTRGHHLDRGSAKCVY